MGLSPAGASGEWQQGGGPLLPRAWRPGWDREHDRCPPDPKGDASPGCEGWRELGLVGGPRWRELHNDRRQVERVLRRSGYVARHRWEREYRGKRQQGPHRVDEWRYIEGPAIGAHAADPWKAAKALGGCGAEWRVSLRQRSDGTLTAVPIPIGCGQGHLCPVCAAGGASARARALRTVLEHHHREAPAELVLLTLTQRASADDTLYEALGRLRAAWLRLRRGRTGEVWRELVEGAYVGLEVTRGKDGRWWHAHMHVILRLQPGVDSAAAREAIGAEWLSSSAAAAEEWDRHGFGWNPVAGGCLMEDDIVKSWEGPWWKAINPASQTEIYQACKYACPVVELGPVELAEFVAVAYLKHWHQGYGSLRSVTKLAGELEGTGWELEEAPELAEGLYREDAMPALDLGTAVAGIGPGDAPSLDEVAPELGRAEDADLPTELDNVGAFRLLLSAVSAVSAQLDLIGGTLGIRERGGREEVMAWIPMAWIQTELRANIAALSERRRRQEEARAARQTRAAPD